MHGAAGTIVVVNVMATQAGSLTNTTGTVSSTNGGTGSTASANLSGVAPPSISEAFNPVLIGQIPLELLDWVVDPKGQRLIGNPEHGGEQIMEVF